VSNDIIGAVYIDLNALLHPEANGSVQGWFPIYDTLRGVRGELRLKIRLEFFNNVNAFTDSSAGAVQFFSSSAPLGRLVPRVAHLEPGANAAAVRARGAPAPPHRQEGS
jgi:hypothetical protein